MVYRNILTRFQLKMVLKSKFEMLQSINEHVKEAELMDFSGPLILPYNNYISYLSFCGSPAMGLVEEQVSFSNIEPCSLQNRKYLMIKYRTYEAIETLNCEQYRPLSMSKRGCQKFALACNRYQKPLPIKEDTIQGDHSIGTNNTKAGFSAWI